MTPVPVFAAAGTVGWGPVQELRGRPEVRLVTSPRHGRVLLVAGAIPHEHAAPLYRVHDQVPHPRTVVTWPVDASDGATDDVIATIVQRARQVEADPSTSSPDRLPDVEAHEWRGVGPFGQGGEGMMGGTPYGRPMAMTGDDRDGLTLDQLHLTLGPFLDPLPPGLELDVVLQGEIVQEATLRWAEADNDTHGAVGEARRGLRRLAHALHGPGLDAHAARAARLAAVADVDSGRATSFPALRRMVRWTGWPAVLHGVGVIDGVDARGRWDLVLDRIEAALAGREVPPVPPAPDDEALTAALAGLTLTDAVTTLVSIDPAGRRSPAPAAS